MGFLGWFSWMGFLGWVSWMVFLDGCFFWMDCEMCVKKDLEECPVILQ
jgi:hypothetical protein